MATSVYVTKDIELIGGIIIEVKPLKIKYLRKVMDSFEKIHDAKNDLDAMEVLSECVYYCFKQYAPHIANSREEVEDYIDMDIIHEILEFGAGIKMKQPESEEEPIKKQAEDGGKGWKDLDLVKIESEVFILGIWKDYDELETNMSMPEIISLVSTKRELEYEEKKFLAALQGVDLDKNNKDSGQNKWEEMKARVFSGGATSDPNDILSLQGVKAQQLGFGIGFGLDYDNQLPTKSDSV